MAGSVPSRDLNRRLIDRLRSEDPALTRARFDGSFMEESRERIYIVGNSIQNFITKAQEKWREGSRFSGANLMLTTETQEFKYISDPSRFMGLAHGAKAIIAEDMRHANDEYKRNVFHELVMKQFRVRDPYGCLNWEGPTF